MLTVHDIKITFAEIPGEVSLTFSVGGCKNNCDGCHSKHLRDKGPINLTVAKLKKLLDENRFITCVTFLGGERSRKHLLKLISVIKSRPSPPKVALYTGAEYVKLDIYNAIDYLKAGHYDKDKGPLTSPTTNQRLINTKTGENITYMFWTKQKEYT